MVTSKLSSLLLAVGLLLTQPYAYGQGSSVVTVSGRAVDQNGRPLRGDRAITIDVYDGSSAQASVATVTRNIKLSDGGVFSFPITIEDLPELPDELWLRITIAGLPPLPMQKITSAFFARSANSAKSAKRQFKIIAKNGNFVSFKVADDLPANTEYTLPEADGAAGSFLSTDGSGKLTWKAASGSQADPVTGSNVGAGSGVFAGKAGNDMKFKSIKGSNGIIVSATSDTITIEGNQTGGVIAMDKAVYDNSGSNGIVDNAERLMGFSPEFFRNASNINMGVIGESYVDPAIARLSQIPYKTPQDLQQALNNSYAPLSHTHSASDINSGVLSEAFIDSSIARDSEIAYKDSDDLKRALDSVYAPVSHTHNATQISQDPMHRFVSDGERLQWGQSSSAIQGATPLSTNNTLVTRDNAGGADFNRLKTNVLELTTSNGQVSIQADAASANNLSFTLPNNAGTDGQVLSTNGAGGLLWRDLGRGGFAIRDSARNLSMQNDVTAPNDSVRVQADEIIMQDASGKALQVFGINLLLSLATKSDDNSDDASSWYHVWLISNGSTIDGRFSHSSVRPAIPSATYAAYVGAIYNNASGNFMAIIQRGKHVVCEGTSVLTAGIATNYSQVNLSNAVPSNATTVQGDLGLSQDFSVYAQGIYVSAAANGLGEQRFVQYTEAGLTDELSWGFSSVLGAPQTLYYRCYHKLGASYCAADRTQVFIRIKGWEY